VNRRLVILGVAAIAVFAASTPAQNEGKRNADPKDALYAQSDWLKASFAGDGYAPDDPLSLPARLSLPSAELSPRRADEPPSKVKTDPFGSSNGSNAPAAASISA